MCSMCTKICTLKCNILTEYQSLFCCGYYINYYSVHDVNLSIFLRATSLALNPSCHWYIENVKIFQDPNKKYWSRTHHGPLTRYVKLHAAHVRGTPGTFSPPLRVSDPDMHHGTCLTRLPQFYISGKRPMKEQSVQRIYDSWNVIHFIT